MFPILTKNKDCPAKWRATPVMSPHNQITRHNQPLSVSDEYDLLHFQFIQVLLKFLSSQTNN